MLRNARRIRLGSILRMACAIGAGALAPAAVWAEEQAAPFSRAGGEPVSLAGMLQMLTGLLLIVLLIFGIAWLVKRFGRFSGMASEHLKVIGGLNIGQREKIVIVQAGGARLVVGVSPGGIRTLHVLDSTEFPTQEAGPGAEGQETFVSRLNQELKRRWRS